MHNACHGAHCELPQYRRGRGRLGHFAGCQARSSSWHHRTVQQLSVGEVAGRLGVAPSTVRMWGSRYGLTASARSAGGHRRYSPDDVERLQRMQRAVLAGADPAAAAADALTGTAGVLTGDADGSAGSADGSAGSAEGSAGSADGSAGNAGAGESAGSLRGPVDAKSTTADEPPPASVLIASVGPALGDDSPPRARRGGPGGAVLAVPGAGPIVRGVARAAARLDENAVTESVLDSLRANGTLTSWNELLRPVLVAAGEHWQRTGTGIEVEHLLTQAVTTAFTQYIATLLDLAQVTPVVLAGGPREDHVLALHAVRAALAERGVPVRFLGPRTPMSALAGTARLTRAPAALIWMSVHDASAAGDLPLVAAAHRRLVLLVGGPGWAGLDTGPAVLCTSLEQAVTSLAAAWTNAVGPLAATKV